MTKSLYFDIFYYLPVVYNTNQKSCLCVEEPLAWSHHLPPRLSQIVLRSAGPCIGWLLARSGLAIGQSQPGLDAGWSRPDRRAGLWPPWGDWDEGRPGWQPASPLYLWSGKKRRTRLMRQPANMRQLVCKYCQYGPPGTRDLNLVLLISFRTSGLRIDSGCMYS